jgi:hypothetical protein
MLATACVSSVPVRVSAAPHLPAGAARAQFAADAPTVTSLLTGIMRTRGFNVAYAVDAPDGSRVLMYKGHRVNVTTVEFDPLLDVNREETNEIGSWFAIRFRVRSGGTAIEFVGKPTVRGTEVCSDEDSNLADVEYWCRDTRVREDYPRRDLLKGRAEAEVIMGALEELRQALEAQGG